MGSKADSNRKIYVVQGENADKEVIREIIRLDTLVYPKKYQTILENATEWYLKNKDIFTFLFDDQKLIGYICILPISNNLYDQIKNGTVAQDVYIPKEDVLEYIKGVTYNVYIFSVVLDPIYHGTAAVKYLINGMYDNLSSLTAKGIGFDKVLADAVSAKGEKLVSSLGLVKMHCSNHDSTIYEGSYTEMMRNINSKK